MPGVHSGTAGGSPLAGGGAPVSTVMDSRLVGTPCYMDPEYLRTGRFGPKSDVYSLGEWWWRCMYMC
jgi:serine/threonine protein kinase